MSEPELTWLDIARTPFEARIILGILEEAGIPAYIDGTSLADEVAVSRLLMNAAGVRIQVRQVDLDAAVQAIAAAKAQAPQLEADGAPDSAAPAAVARQPGAWSWSMLVNFLLVFLVLLLGVICLQLRTTLKEYSHGGGLVWDFDGPNEWARWADTGAMAVHRLDQDRDGHAEQIKSYNRQGVLTSISHDKNSNGMAEVFEEFTPDGRRVLEAHDRDEDGRIESYLVFYTDQTRGLWTDQDGDGVLERREVQDAEGKRLFVEIDRPGRGFERQ